VADSDERFFPVSQTKSIRLTFKKPEPTKALILLSPGLSTEKPHSAGRILTPRGLPTISREFFSVVTTCLGGVRAVPGILVGKGQRWGYASYSTQDSPHPDK
jgi:hypothetical protein